MLRWPLQCEIVHGVQVVWRLEANEAGERIRKLEGLEIGASPSPSIMPSVVKTVETVVLSGLCPTKVICLGLAYTVLYSDRSTLLALNTVPLFNQPVVSCGAKKQVSRAVVGQKGYTRTCMLAVGDACRVKSDAISWYRRLWFGKVSETGRRLP